MNFRPVSGLTLWLAPVHPPSHDESQWLIGCIFNVYRCGGSVGFSPTSRLTLMDIKAPEEGRILDLPRHIVKCDNVESLFPN
tara:strand:- start:55407 stop:55652 length:246 start_codon:yes stop_codon:yes gene_type:complete